MKATQRDFRQHAPRAARDARVFFFCGPDESGASAAAEALVELFAEPGERVELSGGDLRSDPVLLADEARSTSLFGGARHIWVRASGDEAHDAVKNLLDTYDAGEGDGACPVVVVATSASDKARTAKLLEKRGDGFVGMFYPPDLRSVAHEVRRMAGALGLKMADDLSERIAAAAGLDQRLARSEIEKLALYCDASPQSPHTLTAADLDAVGASTEEDGFMPLVNAVLSGTGPELAGEFRRLREVSLNPVGLLLAFERRAAQLAQLAARLGPRGNVNNFIESERAARRVFFGDAQDLKVQLSLWRGQKLDRLLRRLAETHRQLLSNSQAADVLLAQELTQIARHALDAKRLKQLPKFKH
ncbi:DNA polymerase III subunit delta [Altererythrobacter salegens]|uniref:DNA-directed DNA polymerase n=1 Tax=Croceibacterium salegens TaxID=1737568 RepID=A0A6I4SYE1_9SPHN|nr:DNA polymerase III subunit delta [Croceibacterium salegens]MXO59866.1 DNA polymerase III subunit delta [Croceibacterium salegens]